MRVTLLGHASILVEMAGSTCLMDPVFFDPFEEGAVVSCPSRIVYPDQIPPLDILVISHRHPDHFDLASLDQVQRDCDVICAADPLIVYGLRKLGFARIHAVEPMGEISSEEFELYPIRSEAPVREFGMIFKDRSGVFLNQVDSPISFATIDALLARFGHPDLMFAMYASQNFEFFESHRTLFPRESHRQNLATVIHTKPRMVVPGAAGFRFCGDHEWLNRFLFPISARRFVSDLHSLEPEITTCIIKPGDVVEIEDGNVRYKRGASEVAEMKEDDTGLIDFDPTATVPPLNDPNPEGYRTSEMEEITRDFVARQLAAFAFGSGAADDPVIRAYRRYRVRYALGLVFPESATRWYSFDFADEGDAASLNGRFDGEANIVHRIAASALCGWIVRRKSFFYVRAYSRRFTTLYELDRNGDNAQVKPVTLPDLLMHFLLNVAPGSETAARRHIDLELEALERRRSVSGTG